MTEPVTPTPISPLPPAPLITDAPEVFDDKAFPFAASLDTLRAQVNVAAGQTNQNAVAAKEGAAASASSATSSQGYADASSGSASASQSSASAAAISANAAASSESSAASDADSISRMDLGPHATFPTTDNQGRPIIVGAHFLYTGATPNAQYAWDGTQWLIGMNVTAGVTQLNGQAGAVSLKTIGGIGLTGTGDISPIPNIIRSPRASNTVLAVGDKGLLVDITSGTFTQTFAAAATLGDGWWCYLQNSGTVDITLDPNASETIDGVATKTLDPGQTVIVQCDGTALRTIAISGVGNHYVTVHTGNGHGSTNTNIRRFTTAQGSAGTAITYSDSATLGASFTINEPGIYAIQYEDPSQTGQDIAISLNSTAAPFSLTAVERLAYSGNGGNNSANHVSCVTRLAVGSVVRACTEAGIVSTTPVTTFKILKVGT